MKELPEQELMMKEENSILGENGYEWYDNENMVQVIPKSMVRAQDTQITTQKVILKRARPRASSALERLPVASATAVPFLLIGLEAICNAVGAGPRTVKLWMRKEGFPARRYSDGVYRADPYSVQRWFSKETLM